MKVTILTPTYNRSHTLERLYNSLIKQTNNNFEWMIVDDGSKDNTESLVKQFINDNKINIEYIKKENGGKHTALNVGIKETKNEMIFIVDSDDFITEDAVDIISCYYEKYKNEKGICGFSFLKANTQTMEVIGQKYSKDEYRDNYINCRINKNVSGDKAEVYYTDVLKKYPFPEYEGEKFLSEDVVWIEVAKKYDTIYINKIIYYCEYLSDGLTSNDKKMKFASSLGSMHRGKQMMSNKINLKTKIKGAIIYNCYKREINCSVPRTLKLDRLIEKILVALTKWLGIIYHKKWKKSINRGTI